MQFTNTWFNNSELKHNISRYINKEKINTVLEIGSYEGASACFISDHFLDHEQSTLTCVDPFDTNDSTTNVYGSIKNTFIANISLSKNYHKIILYEMTSDMFFKNNIRRFTFIYLDGSHIVENIIRDLFNAIQYCEMGGIIWMDDYLGDNGNIKPHIDSFYEKYKYLISIVHKGYQIAFKRLDTECSINSPE